jgi:hypothetical protein
MATSQERNRGIARMASMQAVAHMPLILGGNTNTRPPKVFRVIDGHDVYHLGHCDWFLGDPPVERRHYRHHLFGTFYHPNLVMAQYDIGGDAKAAIDTRVPDWYVLWIGTRIDNTFMPSGLPWDWIPVCWTPKAQGDSVTTAGRRMFKAWLLDQGYAKPEQNQVELHVEDWCPSKSLQPLFLEITNQQPQKQEP